MNVYEAMHAAADQIEQNPKLWDFLSIEVPDCGTPACALGRIGYFLGFSHDYKGFNQTAELLSPGQPFGNAFYEAIKEFGVTLYSGADLVQVARALRLYAEKYHAPAKPETPHGIPASIRAICEWEAEPEAVTAE